MPGKPLFDQLREVSPLISVGILTADLMSLGSELNVMEDASVKLLHIDVMDGGITRNNITDVVRMNADIIVTGSAVFDGKTPLENARFMIDAAREASSRLWADYVEK